MAQQPYNQNRGGGYQGGGGNQQESEYDLNSQKQSIEKWVKSQIDADTVKFADKFGDFIAANGKGMTNSQIRNIFGEMRRIQMNGFNQKEKISFILLKPKMAYVVKRFKENKKLKPFSSFFQSVMT